MNESRGSVDPAASAAIRFAAIVVAAGAGARFGADRPKALLELDGRPLVAHAVDRMIAAGASTVVVVVPEAFRSAFADALAAEPVTALVSGGTERTESVRNGLAPIRDGADPPPIVLVQDAARPMVPTDVTRRVVQAVASGAPAVVPVVPVTDTVRELTGDGSRMLDRSRLRAVQTPQGFATTALLSSYERLAAGEPVTDDAGVCERAGHPVTLVDGSPLSFKITYPEDLARAEQVLAEAVAR